MSRGVLVLLIGILLVLGSLFADSIGLGTGSGIGWKQITGMIVGIVLVFFGARLRSRGGSSTPAA